MRPTITVCINTYNEAKNLPDCLDSVKDLVDEIVVVDMHSVDATREIAKHYGAKVYLHKKLPYADPARNFAFKKATGDWILMLDADERIPKTLAGRLRAVADDPEGTEVVYLPRLNLWFGRPIWYSGWWPDYNPRFWRRGVISWPKRVHGQPEVSDKFIHLPAAGELAVTHYSITSISSYLRRIDTYSELTADIMEADKIPFRRRHIILMPWREFRRRFLGECQGYRDGFDGLMIALFEAIFKLACLLKYWERHQDMVPDDRGQRKWQYLYNLVRDKHGRPKS